MADRDELTFQRYDAERARDIRDIVERIYQTSYVEAIASGDPFDSIEQFMVRFDAYTSPTAARGFDMVVAYNHGEPAGQSWGWPLAAGTPWWSNLDAEPSEPGFTREDGTRTFALSEIMVRQDLAGRGIARALHDELLRARRETRATLLVEPDNDRAYRAYRSWGWRKVARSHPDWPDAPWYDVLILDLPI